MVKLEVQIARINQSIGYIATIQLLYILRRVLQALPVLGSLASPLNWDQAGGEGLVTRLLFWMISLSTH